MQNDTFECVQQISTLCNLPDDTLNEIVYFRLKDAANHRLAINCKASIQEAPPLSLIDEINLFGTDIFLGHISTTYRWQGPFKP